MAGSSPKAHSNNQRKRLMKHYEQRELPETVTRDEVKCQKCDFKARYKFYRCPQCDEIQKE